MTTVSLSIPLLIRRALAMSALTVTTTTDRLPLTTDDEGAVEAVADMIIGNLTTSLFPHLRDATFDGELMVLEVNTWRALSGGEQIALRAALETAVVSFLMAVTTDNPRFDSERELAVAGIRRMVGGSAPEGQRLPYLY